MTAIEPVRFEDSRVVLVAGLRRSHAFADCANTIPGQWTEFRSLGRLPGQVGSVAYGVMCGLVPGGFEYMSGVEVSEFASLPADMGRMRIPAHRYAVFEHQGHVSGIQAAWQRIWNEWLPRSGYRNAHRPDFERYDERFDPVSRTGVTGLWCPVEKAVPGAQG